MKKYDISYFDETEYRKLERGLKKFNIPAFKKLNFEYYPSLRTGEFLGELIYSDEKNGTETYELKLPSDHLFTQVHGEVKLRYIVYKKQNTVMLDTIMPTDLLLEGLTTYKGGMISKSNASKDKFMIDLLNMLSSD